MAHGVKPMTVVRGHSTTYHTVVDGELIRLVRTETKQRQVSTQRQVFLEDVI